MLKNITPLVSIIIPCFNSKLKITKCISSLLAQKADIDFEVIFIDDASNDGTSDMLKDKCLAFDNWKLICLETNSGSPSHPRNVGINAALGKYIFFLDSDDQIAPDTISIHVEKALTENFDILRSKMRVNRDSQITDVNTIDDWDQFADNTQRIQKVLTSQTLTKSCLFSTSLLRTNKIYFDEKLRMGEDVLFVTEAITKCHNIGYIDHVAYTYNNHSSNQGSTTSNFGTIELSNQLAFWPRMQELYLTSGISYYSSRFINNLSYVIDLLIHKRDASIGISEIQYLQSFLHAISDEFDVSLFSNRKKEIISTLLTERPESVLSLLKPRLLIAGYDLKFIYNFIPALSSYFLVDIDSWSGHNSHDEEVSHAKLAWADYIFCEWLLGNSVWYSKHKQKHQKLVIRMHRFELGLQFGDGLCIDNVDAIITVCALFFEKFLERFSSFSRNKVRLLPLGYQLNQYTHIDDQSKLFNLAIIGILPSRKGLLHALEILDYLLHRDKRYMLHIYGKNPSELSWIASDRKEMNYFDHCDEFISSRNLKANIKRHGHVDIPKALASDKIGFVLSLSSSVPGIPGFEAFHTAVGDGYAAKCISLIKHYDGSEFIWPKMFIHQTIDHVSQAILRYNSNDHEQYIRDASYAHSFVEKKYSEDAFITNLVELFRSI